MVQPERLGRTPPKGRQIKFPRQPHRSAKATAEQYRSDGQLRAVHSPEGGKAGLVARWQTLTGPTTAAQTSQQDAKDYPRQYHAQHVVCPTAKKHPKQRKGRDDQHHGLHRELCKVGQGGIACAI